MASGASVLIVDDDPATLVALPDIITTRIPGASVTTYESAIMGLEALRTSDYEAVAAYVRTPEMDGLTLMCKVRQIREYTPVVVMSSITECCLAKRMLEAGAFAVIQMPFDHTELTSAIWLAVQCSKLRERVARGERLLTRLSVLHRQDHP
jgi:DNA-binding NtrC family response regulator